MMVTENMELESFDVPGAYLNASLQPGRFHMMAIDKHIAKLLISLGRFCFAKVKTIR